MESKVTALEEEIGILKGEIKSILQEVRTAILASENPFTGGSSRPVAAFAVPATAEPAAAAPSPGPASVAVPASIAPAQPAPPSPANHSYIPLDEPDMAAVRPLHPEAERETARVRRGHYEDAFGEDTLEEDGAPSWAATRPFASASSAQPLSRRQESRPGARVHPQVDVRSLAALAVWVEETRERLDDERLRIVLGLGRYGGLIDEELESVLKEISSMIAPPATKPAASLNDCLVALRQLDAVMRVDEAPGRIADSRRRPAEGRGAA